MQSSTSIVGSRNPQFGTVQSTRFLDLTESLPNSQIALLLLGQSIDIGPGGAEINTIRSYNPIAIESNMLTPLNPSIINGERIIQIQGNTINLEPAEYGVTVVVSEKTRVSTDEDIIAGLSTLLSDYEMKLKESIVYNTIKSNVGIVYEFTQGGTSRSRKANAKDFIMASAIMDENGCFPSTGFIRATDQVNTRPIGKSYVLATSIKGNSAIKMNLSPEEFTSIERYAGIYDYGYASKGAINRAEIEVMVSSLIDSGTPIRREAYLFGAQPYYKSGQTPINSRMAIRPASESAYGYHSKVEKITSFGIALSNQNRIMQLILAD